MSNQSGHQPPSHWRKCSSCKREINFNSKYWVCSVSTCQKRKHPFVYCSTTCWDVHLPIMNHKSAWAEERFSPSLKQFLTSEQSRSGATTAMEKTPRRRIVTSHSQSASVQTNKIPKDILIVASKLKHYIKETSGLNTSSNVMEALSDIVRHHADQAVERAKAEGRKTVMDRDF